MSWKRQTFRQWFSNLMWTFFELFILTVCFWRAVAEFLEFHKLYESLAALSKIAQSTKSHPRVFTPCDLLKVLSDSTLVTGSLCSLTLFALCSWWAEHVTLNDAGWHFIILPCGRHTRSGGSKHVVRMCFNLSPLHESLAALRKFVPFSCYSDANASLPRRVCDCDE